MFYTGCSSSTIGGAMLGADRDGRGKGWGVASAVCACLWAAIAGNQVSCPGPQLAGPEEWIQSSLKAFPGLHLNTGPRWLHWAGLGTLPHWE